MGIIFFILAFVLIEDLNKIPGVDVGFINPFFCLAVAFLIEGFLGTYGYCKMCGHNTPENRALFAKCYWYGTLIGQCSYYAFWFYYYSMIKDFIPSSKRS
jgi:hypothetical protein